MKTTPLQTLLFTALAILVACQGEQQSSGTSKVKEENSHELVAEQIQQLLSDLPEPSEVPYFIEKTGADFEPALLNALENAENYLLVSQVTALNLGVYGADVAYLASYDKTQESLDYLQKSKELADYINVSSAFDVQIVNRFEENLGDKEALASIINGSIQKTTDILRSDYRATTAVLVISGGYIEGLYLSSGIISKYINKPSIPSELNDILVQMINLIIQQRENLVTLYELTLLLEENELVASLQNNLKQITNAFKVLEEKERLSESDAKSLLMDIDFINLVELIINTRENIVS